MLPDRAASLGLLCAMGHTGHDAVTHVPATRFGAIERDDRELGQRTQHGSFLGDAELFDNQHFRISVTAAAAMDPQQR